MKFKNIFFLFAVLLLGSCKRSFLEVMPKGKVINTTLSDYDLSLSNFGLINIGTDAQVALGDEMAAIETYFNAAPLRTQRLFRYEDDIYEQDENAPELAIPMQNIYNFNMVINEVMNATEGTDADKRRVQAEAKVMRAWAYLLLINYYGKPYSEETAATDPGFPIVTEADITNSSYTRATVKEVYDFIISDLSSAIPELSPQTVHRLRIAKPAAAGMLGKTYVFMGRYQEALPMLNDAIAGLSQAAIPIRLYDYNSTLTTGGSFLPIGNFGPAYPTIQNNEENLFAKQFSNPWATTNNTLVITRESSQLLGPNDLRRKFFKNTPYPSGTAYPDGMLRRSGPNSTQFGLTVPELYLLRAECYARTNNLRAARQDVEALRIKRMPVSEAPVPSTIASEKMALLQFILEERIREFAAQGVRWFDMRRLSVDPLFPRLKFSHSLYNAAGTAIATYEAKPERLTLRFPRKLMAQNPGMKNNP